MPHSYVPYRDGLTYRPDASAALSLFSPPGTYLCMCLYLASSYTVSYLHPRYRFETRMSDEEISKGISRDARRAAELMKKQMEHDKTAAPVSQQTSEQAQQQVPVRAAGADVTDQPSS